MPNADKNALATAWRLAGGGSLKYFVRGAISVLIPPKICTPSTAVLIPLMRDVSRERASATRTSGPISLSRLPINAPRNDSASAAKLSKTLCVAERRVFATALESRIVVSCACSFRSETVWPALKPRLRPTSAWRPVVTSFCAAANRPCAFITERRIVSKSAWVETVSNFIPITVPPRAAPGTFRRSPRSIARSPCRSARGREEASSRDRD